MNVRAEPRQNEQEKIHIQVQHGAQSSEAKGMVLHTQTHDISPNGINASSERALQTGTVLDILIECPHEKAYLLTVEPRWCNKDGAQFRIGFHILENQQSDYIAWQQRFA